MSTLLLKIAVTPILIFLASVVGRRWGEAVGGWLVGLPLTSGPVAVFLAIEQGDRFAADVATGSLDGAGAQACFCIAYGWTASRWRWPPALAAGTVAYAIGAIASQALQLALWPSLLAALAILMAALHAVRPGAAAPVEPRLPARWDIPARMAVATALVLVLTSAAPMLGARLSGILATFPVFAAVLAIFAHRADGGSAAQRVLRGLLMGLFSFAGFFAVFGAALARIGLAPAIAGAALAALAIQACTLLLLAWPRPRERGTRR